VFSGDLVESDLDVEWSGGVAKGADINFVYVGASANFSVWDSLQYSVDNNVAPFISTSYGFCEQGTEQQAPGFSATVRTWAVQGIAQGQTIVAASGDAGAADCESTSSTTATTGLAVDMPASIPEVVGMGGNSFSADAPNCTTACSPGGDPPYWAAAGASTDAISSALGYIGESAWNDTTISVGAGGGFSSTGGGVSTLFTKPSYQAGTGFREVPDVSLTATPNHDPYLFCSQPQSGAPPTCTNGFRDSTGNLNIVGGTSAASPSFAAILALINEYLGNSPPAGIAPVNPILYGLATTAPTVFHDVTAGDNKVPCTTGTTNCPTGTTSIGFSAGVGYDDVTGLGSVDAFAMAQAMSTDPGFTLVPQVGSYQVAQGSNITATVNLIALNGFTGPVRYTCTESVSESTCTGPATEVDSSMPASFSITTAAPTAKLERPFDRSVRIFYATLLPGLLWIVFVAGSRKRSIRGMRLLGLMMVLGFSTLWLGSCGGSSKGPKDPGTPTGSYTITVKGVSGSLTRQTTFQLVVVQ
jgi:subtilase family serine protease